MNKFNKKLSPKVKQKLVGILSIIVGIISIYGLPDEIGWGIILVVIGIYFLFTRKQILEFD